MKYILRVQLTYGILNVAFGVCYGKNIEEKI